MVRKLATQVPQAVTRLLQAQTISPPVWYQAYLEHPPQPLPPRKLAPVDLSLFQRSQSDDKKGEVTHRAKRAKTPKLKIPELRFQEDEIRRRFFTDFPFEALRPVSLVEGQTIDEGRLGAVSGKEWKDLKQRGDVPTVEDTIAFVINLHENHNVTLSQAYQVATRQFIRLRAINEIANFAAEEEALAYGQDVRGTGSSRKAFDRFFDLETRALRTNYTSSSSVSSGSAENASNALPARFLFGPNLPKRRSWSPQMDESATSYGKATREDLDSHGAPMPYSDGLNYVMKWKAFEGKVRSRREKGKRSDQKEDSVLAAVEGDEARPQEAVSHKALAEQPVHVQS